jgi:hypothetical protein
MHSREIEEYKKSLSLSSRQRSILVGAILGDAHLETQRRGAPDVARLKIEHSCKQRAYVDWFANEFQGWFLRSPREREKRIYNGNIIHVYGFTTVSHPIFWKFRQQFYRHGKKVVPNDVDDDLDSLSLAVWFMDDGSIKSARHRGIFLNVQGYDNDSRNRLIAMLREKFHIYPTTRKIHSGWQIYIGGVEAIKFGDIVNPHLHDTMRYKAAWQQHSRLTVLPKE